jgi:hypothetical protein
MIVSGIDLFANLEKLSLFFSLLRMFKATMFDAVPMGVAIPPIPVPTASAQAKGAIDEAARVFASVNKVMKGVQKASAADGISIGQSNGRAASQEVFHMHVHIIPRFNHEMMSGFPNRKVTHRAELDEIGKKIKAAIGAQEPTLPHSGHK